MSISKEELINTIITQLDPIYNIFPYFTEGDEGTEWSIEDLTKFSELLTPVTEFLEETE